MSEGGAGKHPETPNGDWHFIMKNVSSIREVEFELKLWEDGAFEHMYTTTVKDTVGSLHRRGQWAAGQGRLFCHVQGQCRITRHPKAPPSVSAAPVNSHQQITYDISVPNQSVTGDEPSPTGPPVLKIQPGSRSIEELHSMGEFVKDSDLPCPEAIAGEEMKAEKEKEEKEKEKQKEKGIEELEE